MTLPLLTIGSCVTDGLVHSRDVDTIQKIGLEEDDTVDDALRLIVQTGVLQQAKDFVKSALEKAVDSAEEHRSATSQAVETWTERVQWDVANDLGGVFGCEGAEPEVWCEMTVSAFGDDFKFHSAEFTVSSNDRDTFNLLCDSMENMDTAVKNLAEAVSRFCQLLTTRPPPQSAGRDGRRRMRLGRAALLTAALAWFSSLSGNTEEQQTQPTGPGRNPWLEAAYLENNFPHLG